MATILTDDFNSYSDGNLVGQGSWTYGTFHVVEPTVQTSVVKEGAKAVSITGAGAIQFYKSGTLTNDGSMVIYVRRSVNTGSEGFYIQLCEGSWTTPAISIGFLSGNIQIYTGSWTTLQAYSADTWYSIDIEWRSSDHKARVSINEGAFSDWQTVEGWTNGVDIVRLGGNQSGAGDVTYFDYIAQDLIPAAGGGKFMTTNTRFF